MSLKCLNQDMRGWQLRLSSLQPHQRSEKEKSPGLLTVIFTTLKEVPEDDIPRAAGVIFTGSKLQVAGGFSSCWNETDILSEALQQGRLDPEARKEAVEIPDTFKTLQVLLMSWSNKEPTKENAVSPISAQPQDPNTRNIYWSRDSGCESPCAGNTEDSACSYSAS